jgi:V8-like Glu-specific endopeptidase
MSDLPLTLEELRHRPREEATADVPEELRGLSYPEDRPAKEVRFIERAPHGERSTDYARLTVDGYRPPWVASSPAPRRARTPKPVTVLHHGQRLEPLVIWPPDDRRVYNDLTYPWGCVCKVTTAAGAAGSGVLIGPRQVLTASHCVDWSTSNPERIDVHLTGTTAAATAFDTAAYAFTQITGPDVGVTNLDEDYAVLIVNERLGDRFGFLGTKTYDSSWDGDNVWSTMGYPGDVPLGAGGLHPTFQTGKNLDEDEWDLGSARAMTTSADQMPGQSGSPMFGTWDDGPYVVAVMSSHGVVWASGTENWCSGGSDLGRLVKQARDENP